MKALGKKGMKGGSTGAIVEILVVTIVAIILIPILQGFIDSANVSTTVKTILNTLTI